MQKNCAKSCCAANQVVSLIETETGAKSGVICDGDNVFMDDVTEPPMGYFQELVLDTIDCSNWAEIKVSVNKLVFLLDGKNMGNR